MQLHSSDIDEGIKTRFWKAVEIWIQENLDMIHLQLEDPEDKYDDVGYYKRLGGSAECLKKVQDLPNVLIQYMEDRLQAKKEEKENGKI